MVLRLDQREDGEEVVGEQLEQSGGALQATAVIDERPEHSDEVVEALCEQSGTFRGESGLGGAGIRQDFGETDVDSEGRFAEESGGEMQRVRGGGAHQSAHQGQIEGDPDAVERNGERIFVRMM